MRKYDEILLVEWTPNYALDKCAAWKVKFTLSFEPTLHFPPLTTRPRNLDLRVGTEGGGCVRRNRSQLCPGATFLACIPFFREIHETPPSRRTSRCTCINPRLAYKGEETLVKAFSRGWKLQCGPKPAVNRLIKLNGKAAEETRIRARAIRRKLRSLKPTTEIGHVKGVSATRLSRTWRASALRVRTVSATNWYR